MSQQEQGGSPDPQPVDEAAVEAPAGEAEAAPPALDAVDEPAPDPEQHGYGKHTELKIAEVVAACDEYGAKSIIALAGVPGTGKSYIASIAAQRFTGEPLLVKEVQFHQSFSYEEFIEGMRIDATGAVVVQPGVFLEWNQQAHDDPERQYAILVEELTRANLSAVLGELLTYLEYRNRAFNTVYSRQPVRIAENLTLLATYNPTDRTALELDSAIVRRLRIIRCPPSTEQLAEMLADQAPEELIRQLQQLFEACQEAHGDQYEHLMPFGHGVFADVRTADDLRTLWAQRIEYLLRPSPLLEPHPFSKTIRDHYPWRGDAPAPGGAT